MFTPLKPLWILREGVYVRGGGGTKNLGTPKVPFNLGIQRPSKCDLSSFTLKRCRSTAGPTEIFGVKIRKNIRGEGSFVLQYGTSLTYLKVGSFPRRLFWVL